MGSKGDRHRAPHRDRRERPRPTARTARRHGHFRPHVGWRARPGRKRALGERCASAWATRSGSSRTATPRSARPGLAPSPAALGIGDRPSGQRPSFQALSLDGAAALRAPCPADHVEQCWGAADESFVAEPTLVAAVERDLAKLESQGIAVSHAACVVTCTLRLNEGVARGLTRFHLDLHAMERLALDARARAGVDVIATCGKVGGFDRYAAAFGPMNGRLHSVAEEGRARSEYAVPGLGRIAFVRDADDSHLLVCMASLVGKWVRDVLMARDRPLPPRR